ncbi:hypothetical protein CAPTEDRAFT_225639 [Capitella teleta]|uniref:Uncharacterized protein n=1 Tax=Capitella teleta TaxID=283909 RepID=R7TJ43_CAPTE|nr:hypothetical protein CAPTEDRAFT_225639 [Capitella teleta]|eukprot:ELT93729.1 hypothetical protein CAPTEDRAFT_225639 [Capitella teleta]
MIFGIANPSDNGKTWAMFVVWNKGASITGWVGQCHVCGSNSVEVLETGWLLRSQADHCSESWKSTLYGESSFTRERPAVSAFNTPGEAGEDDQDDVVKSNPCNDALCLRACMLPMLLWALLLTQIYLV